VICDLGDVVVVPFPFVDIAAEKRRPAVVMSREGFNRSNGHSICAMVTTAGRMNWPTDISIANLEAAGLPRACVVRFKLFTLPNSIILRRAGALSESDRNNVLGAVRGIFF
jgi:mRNA interferase MazF